MSAARSSSPAAVSRRERDDATTRSAWRDDEVAALGDLADKFFAKHVTPHRERWEAQQQVDREVWLEAGRLGLLCCSIPEEYGGGGGTFAHDLAVLEGTGRALDTGFGNAVHSGIVAHYILAYGTEEQTQRWLPRMATGETDRGDRDDRAGRRFRPEEHRDDGHCATATTTSSTAPRRSSPTGRTPT